MFRLSTCRVARRRAFALVAMLMLVWCQIVASAHARTMVSMDGMGAGNHMAAMTGCDGLPDTDGDDASDCPSEHASSEIAKLPIFAALPPALPFEVVRTAERGPVALVRHELPQGRAPPRPRLCCWLI